ncbi:putative HTH-type transcriptional regulator YusO [Luteitalea pratensis]|uniref:Putative HTH-type transcriptional regulator YusO n=2 Tax=Luteitalea pratensis TaxID=1855912 RepID=A0A143PQB1_LUTPR|nr:putative HTH-type transcriptional regulator YusO [Luteitalea pratensis]
MPAPPFLVDITCLNISRRHMPTDLEQELKQTRPFKSPHEEAFVGLQRTAALLEHAIETLLKPSGVTATQYNVLRILRGAGEQGLCRSEVGQRMVRRVPDVTRLLDRLEETGLIARTRGGEDRRYVSTTITPKGLETLAAIDEVIPPFLEQHMGALDAEQLQSLTSLLSILRRAHA